MVYYHKFNDQWHISFETYDVHQYNVLNILNSAALNAFKQPVLHNETCGRRNRAWALDQSRHHCQAAWGVYRGRYRAGRLYRNPDNSSARECVRCLTNAILTQPVTSLIGPNARTSSEAHCLRPKHDSLCVDGGARSGREDPDMP